MAGRIGASGATAGSAGAIEGSQTGVAEDAAGPGPTSESDSIMSCSL